MKTFTLVSALLVGAISGACTGSKSSSSAISVAASLATSSPASSSSATSSSATSSSATSSSALSIATAQATVVASNSTPVTSTFATTDGLLFDIDGVSQYFAGTNCYWCGFLTENTDVDQVFSDIAASGLKVVRVWGFNDVTTKPTDGTVYYQYLSASGSEINTGADGLKRLDYVVEAAEANGLKLIINFVNNWSDYGGIAAYVSAFGGSATSWFSDSASQTQYQTYIQAVVSRYSNSTAVFAWELANEPRCSGCDVSVVYNWASTTSAYIKSLDANHMVTMGDEGFGPLDSDDGSYPYTTAAGGYTWLSNLNISTIDFGTMHLYPDSWGQEYDWGTAWVTSHGAACAAAGKPCILEEYGGGNNCTVENPWQDAALATSGIAGDLFWQYGDTLPSTGSQTSDDGNTIYYNEGNWDCMVTDHIADIKAANAS